MIRSYTAEMCPQPMAWKIDRLHTTDQEVRGSTPLGRANFFNHLGAPLEQRAKRQQPPNTQKPGALAAASL